MKKSGFARISLLLLFASMLICGAALAAGSPDNNADRLSGRGESSADSDEWQKTPPYEVDSFYICLGETIVDTTVITSDSAQDPALQLAILDGIGDLTVERPGDMLGIYSFTPDTAGTYYVTLELTYGGEYVTAYYYQLEVFLDPPPNIEDQYFTATICQLPTERTLQIAANDPNGGEMTFALLSGDGTIDASSGILTYTANEVGLHSFMVEVSDLCGADTAMIYDDLTLNDQPVWDGFDSTVILCEPDSVCFDIIASDPEGDSIYISMWEGPGNLEQLTDSSGRVCFLPDDVDSATYTFVFCLIDDCVPSDGDLSVPPCETDTVNITVLINRPPIFATCPEAVSVGCMTGDTCLTFEVFDPDNEPLTLSVIDFPTDYTLDGYTVCFNASGITEAVLAVEIADECGRADTCEVLITGDGGTPPFIDMPDSTMYLCGPVEVCLPVEITDPDGDLDSSTIEVQGGTWDPDSGTVCFIPYDGGEYQIIVSASDMCGGYTVDTATVTIMTDQDIELICPPDTTIFCCELDTFCFPIYGIPEGIEPTVTGVNTWYNAEDSTICFYAECATDNRITVSFSTECNDYFCEFNAKLVCNKPPIVVLPPYDTLSTCESEEICVPVAIADVNQNLDPDSIVVTDGYVFDPLYSQVCFTAEEPGLYGFAVEAFDECGASDRDSIEILVQPNSPPTITHLLEDTLYSQCAPEEICVGIDAGDVDGNLEQIITNIGTYNEATDSICFLPDTAGRYCFEVTAIDDCGALDTTNFCLVVELGNYVSIHCPEGPIDTSICEPGPVPVSVPITGVVDSVVTAGDAVWADDVLTFDVLESGVYVDTVYGYAECNTEMCIVTLNVTIPEPVAIECPPADTVLACEEITLAYAFSVSGPYESVTATSPEGATIQNDSVYFTASEPGTYTISLTATGLCSEATCSTDILVDFNSDPVVVAPPDTSLEACELPEICLPIDTSDVDGNLVEVTASAGQITDTLWCYTPAEFGVDTIIFTAIDECGAIGLDTTIVTLTLGGSALINEIPDQEIDTCSPGTVCVYHNGFSPASAEISVHPIGTYDAENERFCFDIENSDTTQIRVIADAACGSDTIFFDLRVRIGEPPVLTCPDPIDTLMCLVQPTELCWDIELTGTDAQVDSVSHGGTYNEGTVCIPVSEPGERDVTVWASGFCGETSCVVSVNVREDTAPELDLPVENLSHTLCLDDSLEICYDIKFRDLESTPIIEQTCGIQGAFQQIDDTSGQVCFIPDYYGTYEFCFRVMDGCDTVTESFWVEINEDEDCELCSRIWLDSDTCTVVGVTKEVDIKIETFEEIGGFKLLMLFDGSLMTLPSPVERGPALDEWEYFTTTYTSPGCGSNCPPGLVGVIGIADINNGADHPDSAAYTPEGILGTMSFQLSTYQPDFGTYLPIDFIWYDCGDNALSSRSGDDLYLDLYVLNPEMDTLWNEADDVNYPESARPPFPGTKYGAPDDPCMQGDKVTPIRCLEFINGGICVKDPDSIDDRGDLNLNNVAYEIADAVLYSNYFVYGMRVFVINMAGQIAASDVNADGLTLTVADLVLLIRIITGEADPVSGKIVPIEEPMKLTTQQAGNITRINSSSSDNIGGVHVMFDLKGAISVDDVRLGADAVNMDLSWAVENNKLRVLVHDMESQRIAAGQNSLLEIVTSGEGSMELVEADAADYNGRPYEVLAKPAELPSTWSLDQNYPNPFNPTTSISFSLADQADWRLTIYNINGAVVREFTGSNSAGTVTLEWDGRTANGQTAASGVYLYRLEAADFHATKKMMLLK
ncbi:T9SS type A sorting domain-containing protein [candidate division GN15 bacterium]|nr:T9SS type A sorting domain-containing protein [candidate division GN15 bacterium]